MAISVDEVCNELNRIFDSNLSNIRRVAKCRIMLNNVILTRSINWVEMLKEFIKFLAQDSVSLYISRQMFSDFCMKILPWIPDSQSKLLAHCMQEEMQPREVHFEYHLSIVCHHLSHIYEKEGNWKEAASWLASIPAESYYRFSVDYELELFIKIASLYMEDDDPLLAEPYVKKASVLQFLTSNIDLQLSFKACNARMLNFRLKFSEAAQEYYELCICLQDDECLTALKNAIVCTIISFPGAIRTHMLDLLCCDQRCEVFIELSILENLCYGCFIEPREIDEIEKLLLPHQKVKINYDTSILVEAIAEHNIKVIEKLYCNIKIESLGYLLKLEPHKVDLIIRRMIFEERIKGSINQEGVISFERQNPDELLESWLDRIESLNI